jgi:hypothetical protein
MGCGMSTEEKEGKARNEEIENQLKRDRMQQRNEIKMLLLGTLDALGASHRPMAQPWLRGSQGLTARNRCR